MPGESFDASGEPLAEAKDIRGGQHCPPLIESLGKISIAIDNGNSKIPMVFMHGVILDRRLSAEYGSDLTAVHSGRLI